MSGRRVALTYRRAGVDRGGKEAMLAALRPRIRSTHRGGVLGGGDEFGGLFRLRGFRDPVLVSSIDGVGTKTRVAAGAGRWRVIGRDIVAHGVNDVLCHGAAALYMLDYIAAGRLRREVVREILSGIIAACREEAIALLGGETAEMPGVYAPREIEVAGCVVGAVERRRLITGRAIRPGDVIVGIASNGLHTNGYTLARAVLLPAGGGQHAGVQRALRRVLPGLSEPLGDALLRPHRSYGRPVLALCEHLAVRGIAHVTGGGIPGNLVRILPAGCRAVIARGSWRVPPLFDLIQQRGKIAAGEMFRTFNMGLGLLLVVREDDGRAAVMHLQRRGESAWIVGRVVAGPRGVEIRG
jgi:phosphoribosylformylglycinamidine cyclo-ligase